MIKVLISGCNGRMGRVISRLCAEAEDMEVVAGFDISAETQDTYPVYGNPQEFSGKADVVIDFSHPSACNGLLDFAKRSGTPVIFCTTGYSEEQLAAIREAAESVPLFRSGNMSLGVNLLCELVKKAAAVLGESFDIEIVERHHRNKVDAPSGTALMLADAAASSLSQERRYVFDRHSVRQKRGAEEIGISSVRGGSIVGEHEVIFAGNDEVLELKHSAASREIFANGALAAARFMATVNAAGLYSMSDVLAGALNAETK